MLNCWNQSCVAVVGIVAAAVAVAVVAVAVAVVAVAVAPAAICCFAVATVIDNKKVTQQLAKRQQATSTVN